MSEQVQKMLSQLVKRQLEKKSSKKTEEKPSIQKHVFSDDAVTNQVEEFAVAETESIGLKVSEEEQWVILRRLIVENFARVSMIILYCTVAFISIFKAGIIILTAFQHFLHGIFAAAPPTITPKS